MISPVTCKLRLLGGNTISLTPLFQNQNGLCCGFLTIRTCYGSVIFRSGRVAQGHFHERVSESPRRYKNFGTSGSQTSLFVSEIRQFEDERRLQSRGPDSGTRVLVVTQRALKGKTTLLGLEVHWNAKYNRGAALELAVNSGCTGTPSYANVFCRLRSRLRL